MDIRENIRHARCDIIKKELKPLPIRPKNQHVTCGENSEIKDMGWSFIIKD